MPRILLVEDDKYLRAVVAQMLADGGHTVTEAEDGRIAVAIYRPEVFDLIVMDLIMPEKDGMESITELKRKFPAVKIIAMTSGGQFAVKSEYLRMAKCIGAADVLKKPFSQDTLLTMVDRMMREGPAATQPGVA